jgi:general secretion pathway protein I
MRPAATRSTAQHGFTLIEVLAALVIVALGMIAAIQAVTQSARNGTYLREKTLAHWIGMNVLTERRLQAAAPDIAESTGRVEFADQQWQWTKKVTQTQVASLRRIDIAVRRAEKPDDTPLANVSGFYAEAVGGAGGGAGSTQWAGTGAPGTDGTDDEGTDGSVPAPTRPPREPADQPVDTPADPPTDPEE